MKNLKTLKITYWVTTTLFFLFEGVMPALTGQSKLAIEGITHLGYPLYFVTLLQICKVIGSILLILPQVPNKIKEWAYAGFTFNILFATASHIIVDGFNPMSFFPIIVLIVLGISYITNYKINNFKSEDIN